LSPVVAAELDVGPDAAAAAAAAARTSEKTIFVLAGGVKHLRRHRHSTSSLSRSLPTQLVKTFTVGTTLKHSMQ